MDPLYFLLMRYNYNLTFGVSVFVRMNFSVNEYTINHVFNMESLSFVIAWLMSRVLEWKYQWMNVQLIWYLIRSGWVSVLHDWCHVCYLNCFTFVTSPLSAQCSTIINQLHSDFCSLCIQNWVEYYFCFIAKNYMGKDHGVGGSRIETYTNFV
jgi:hypothetical protein